MATPGILRTAGCCALLLVLASCAQPDGAGGRQPTSTTGAAPGATADLVLQVAHTGGFVTPQMLLSRLPVVTVYGDGRVISEGPQIAIYPGPALPNLQVRRIDGDAVQRLVDLALEAGVGDDLDLGSPPIADAPSTRFTVVHDAVPRVLEVYALDVEAPAEPPGAGTQGLAEGLTDEQLAARAGLRNLVDALTAPGETLGEEAVTGPETYAADAVAAVVTPWMEPGEDLGEHPEVPWPGPPLPGDPLAAGLDVSCTTAAGQQADAVLEAAHSANALTPWVSDGQRWSVVLRPLLPHESDCEDLRGA